MEAKIGLSVILINKYNQVLIGKRKGSHGEGMFSIPGGHLEYMETYAECCKRELLEEIGVELDTTNLEPVGFSEDFFGDKQYTTLYFALFVNHEKINILNMEPDKCEGWEWVDIQAIPNEMFCDTYNQINKIEKYI